MGERANRPGRRRILRLAAAVGTLGLAGCIEDSGESGDTENGSNEGETDSDEDETNPDEDGPLEVSAESVWVAEDVLSEAEYEETRTETEVIERSFEAGGDSRTVEVGNQLAEYQRLVDLGPLGEHEAARFTALATPQVEILGETFNPVGDMSNAELAETVQSVYEDIEIGDEVDSHTATLLGEEVEVSKFEGEATFEGFDVDVYAHLAQVAHGEDYVIPVGVYPQLAERFEEENVLALIEGVEHDG